MTQFVGWIAKIELHHEICNRTGFAGVQVNKNVLNRIQQSEAGCLFKIFKII